MDTNGKVAVITGGASGIGLALAERFLADGMKVVLADIDDQRLREVEARLSESGGEVAAMKCDTASDADLEALAQFALDQFGAAHVLCNTPALAGSVTLGQDRSACGIASSTLTSMASFTGSGPSCRS